MNIYLDIISFVKLINLVILTFIYFIFKGIIIPNKNFVSDFFFCKIH